MGAPDVVSAFAQGIALAAGPESAAFLAAIGDAAEKAWAGLGFPLYFTLRFAGREWPCRGNTHLGLLRIQGEPGGGLPAAVLAPAGWPAFPAGGAVMPGKIDFPKIKAAALNDARRIVEAWAPGGRYEGPEYSALNPRRPDRAAGSFKVNVVEGVWSDFAINEGGSDLISLVAYLDGVGQAEAARELARFLGMPEAAGAGPAGAPGRPVSDSGQLDNKTPDTRPAWRPLLPVPDAAPPPPAGHPKRGRPAIRHEYRDGNRRLLFLVDRHEAAPPEHPRKDFYPLAFCEGPEGRRAWRWQAPEAPRPLYGLDRLAARPEAPVILCEGEKAADAAAILAPDVVCMTWPGGSQAVKKADFGALKDRAVLL